MSVDARLTAPSGRELAALVRDTLGLEDFDPERVDLGAPLFDGGLGLDSLDMLEIALAIQQRYGVRLRSNDPDKEHIFASLESLARHIGTVMAAPA